jgi:ubiquinone/menaquinone biosynthesis C-methylase UbiE
LLLIMERIPEPEELMDDATQALAYDQGDFTTSHSRRIELFRERYPQTEIAGTVLDLGTGSGDMLERFAGAYPRARFVAVDGAAAMLDLARRRVAGNAAMQGRVSFVTALLPADSIPRGDYRVVMSHSMLHHLYQPQVLWQTISQHAGGNSFVFVADLRRPASASVAAQTIDTLAANEPEVLRRDFYNSLCAAFTADEVRAQLAQAGLNLKVEEVDDIHLLAYGFR